MLTRFEHSGDQGPPAVVGPLAQQDPVLLVQDHAPHSGQPQRIIADFLADFTDEFRDRHGLARFR